MQFRPNERVSIEISDSGVAQVRLTRPDKLNALDPARFDRLIEAGLALHDAKGLRAVVLSGEGRAFCAGIDLASLGGPEASLDQPDISERTHGNANRFQQVAMQWRKLPVPVVTAVHGICFGGGLQIASGADIRVAAPDTRLSIMEGKWGIVPDMGGYALWRGLVRDDVLRELIYTQREFTGEEAREYGIATFVDADPHARATAIAEEIAARSPHATRAAKRLANAMQDKTTEQLLLEESYEQHGLLRTRNQVEAVMAGVQKRAPKFEDV